MDENQKLNASIEEAFARHTAQVPKPKTKKPRSRTQRLGRVMAWMMIILSVGGLVMTALISSGIVG